MTFLKFFLKCKEQDPYSGAAVNALRNKVSADLSLKPFFFF
jgi:hypothetical protein